MLYHTPGFAGSNQTPCHGIRKGRRAGFTVETDWGRMSRLESVLIKSNHPLPLPTTHCDDELGGREGEWVGRVIPAEPDML